MSKRLRVLLVEDSEDDAALVVRALSTAASVVSERVDTADGLRGGARPAGLGSRHRRFLDARVQRHGRAGDRSRARSGPSLIFVSGTIGEDVAVAAMRTGAHDYIIRATWRASSLPSSRNCGTRRYGASARWPNSGSRISRITTRSPTFRTGRSCSDRLQQAILGAQRDAKLVSFLLMDLDGFKEINDALGHHAGDRVLQQLASRLRAVVRDADTVARLGGDEFAMILPSTDTGAPSRPRGR